MKKTLFTVLLASAVTIMCAADKGLPDPFFKLAERNFTLAEAQAIAPGKSDPAALRSALESRFPAAAAVVLCSRSGIALSQERTSHFIKEAVLMLSEAQRKEFDLLLAAENITLQEYLERESKRFDHQLNEALRRWFKQISGDRSISSQQISDYYYRNMQLFRRTMLNEQLVLVFDAGKPQLTEQAHSNLMQGALFTAVRKNFALDIPGKDYLEDLKKHYSQRTALEGGYRAVQGAKYNYIVMENALREMYLPLDEKLSAAIANTLYDALAKAYLAEELNKKFKDQKIIFY